MASRPFQLGLVGPTTNATAAADTTYTKIFVGGLAWETQRDTMRCYFEQFGDILEAVVITDKNTGRSKGYGFVTFKDPDSAMRACQDPSPVIDGRRANCNLACLGAAQRPRPHPPQYGMGRLRQQEAGMIAASAYRGPSIPSASTAYYQQPSAAPHYALQQPYWLYGYSAGYSQENMYPMNYFGVGGQQQQFAPYYPAAAAAAAATPGVYPGSYYPYYAQYSQSAASQAQSGFGLQLHYPQMLQYNPYSTQAQFGSAASAILSLPTASFAPPTAGVNVGATIVSGPLQQPPRNGNAADQH